MHSKEVHFILSSISMWGKIFSTMFLHVEVIPSKIEFVNENLCTRFKWPLPSPVIKQLIWKSGETGACSRSKNSATNQGPGL